MDALELEINRVNTKAFIDVKPTSVVLTPQKKVRTAGGGYKMVDEPAREPQTFRIIELGMNVTPPVLELTDGSQRTAEFWLLGEWDAKVGIDDYWSMIDGASERVREWIVGDIVRSNHYETRALVAERGA